MKTIDTKAELAERVLSVYEVFRDSHRCVRRLLAKASYGTKLGSKKEKDAALNAIVGARDLMDEASCLLAGAVSEASALVTEDGGPSKTWNDVQEKLTVPSCSVEELYCAAVFAVKLSSWEAVSLMYDMDDMLRASDDQRMARLSRSAHDASIMSFKAESLLFLLSYNPTFKSAALFLWGVGRLDADGESGGGDGGMQMERSLGLDRARQRQIRRHSHTVASSRRSGDSSGDQSGASGGAHKDVDLSAITVEDDSKRHHVEENKTMAKGGRRSSSNRRSDGKSVSNKEKRLASPSDLMPELCADGMPVAKNAKQSEGRHKEPDTDVGRARPSGLMHELADGLDVSSGTVDLTIR